MNRRRSKHHLQDGPPHADRTMCGLLVASRVTWVVSDTLLWLAIKPDPGVPEERRCRVCLQRFRARENAFGPPAPRPPSPHSPPPGAKDWLWAKFQWAMEIVDKWEADGLAKGLRPQTYYERRNDVLGYIMASLTHEQSDQVMKWAQRQESTPPAPGPGPSLEDDMETEDECCARTVREEMAAAGHPPAHAIPDPGA